MPEHDEPARDPADEPGDRAGDRAGDSASDRASDEGVGEHKDEGLDLARAQARATSRVPGVPAKRSRKPGSGSAFTPRSRGRSKSSGAHPDDRDPQLLGSALDRLVANHGWAFDLQVQGVFARWAELVGDEVADHCTPETLTDGKLVVRTDSTAWATQLKLLAPTVVRRLNGELGDGTVVLIEVLGPHLPSWKKGPRTTRGRGPRDTYG